MIIYGYRFSQGENPSFRSPRRESHVMKLGRQAVEKVGLER